MKNFGLGLVYIILLPLLLLVLAAFALYCLGLGLVMFFQATVRFFQGLQPLPPFEEDLKVAEIKQAQVENQIHPNGVPSSQPQSSPAPQSVYVQNNYYQTPNPSAPQQPAPQAQNTPIDANGYFKNPTQANALPNQPVPPTLDVTAQAQSIAQQPQTPDLQKIVQQPSAPTSNTPSVIDLSLDDGKDNS